MSSDNAQPLLCQCPFIVTLFDQAMSTKALLSQAYTNSGILSIWLSIFYRVLFIYVIVLDALMQMYNKYTTTLLFCTF